LGPKRKAYWQGYIREIAGKMGLEGLPIVLLDTPASGDANIEVNLLHGRNLVEIKLSCDWEERKPERQRWSVVHDLHHCIFRRTYIYVEQNVEAYMAKREAEAWLRNFTELFEVDTDSVASSAWAQMLPLPAPGATK